MNFFQDTLLVIEKYKSGFQPPEDFPFEDLSKGGSDSGSANNINNIQVSGKLKDGGYTVKGTITGKAMKKRTGLFHIFGSRGVCTKKQNIFSFVRFDDFTKFIFDCV